VLGVWRDGRRGDFLFSVFPRYSSFLGVFHGRAIVLYLSLCIYLWRFFGGRGGAVHFRGFIECRVVVDFGVYTDRDMNGDVCACA